MSNETTLDMRTGLPDALRILLAESPRDLWQAHQNFDGLVRFWMERHLMFRQALTRLQSDAEAALDAKADPMAYRRNTQRLAGFFLNELHGHHQIEDVHYFPKLTKMEPRLDHGFELLDGDHKMLDGYLNDLADKTNDMLRANAADFIDTTATLRDTLVPFERFLDRHLIDEEDLIVPVLLRDGSQDLM
jgi:iron-sulfur cluster repair protein YtfE (RIC family)